MFPKPCAVRLTGWAKLVLENKAGSFPWFGVGWNMPVLLL
jgi:hypothetical protein